MSPEEMKIPTIHLNGTSWKELLAQVVNASREIRRAEDALREAWPNGRDYYPQGPEALPEAIKQWESLAADLGRARLCLEEVANGISDQEPTRDKPWP